MTDAIVIDIEGTVSALRFVRQVLFPYAERALPTYVAAHREVPAVAAILEATARLATLPVTDTQALVDQLLAWSRDDQKIAPLKELQGLIWREGYVSGELRAHVYVDAVWALRRWHAAGIPLYVYSSGSVEAQRAFFRYSESGDLSGLFLGYFDTAVGPKGSTASYRNIAAQIGARPQYTLFLSDVVAELDAARAAGWRTAWVQRPTDGFTTPVASDHDVVTDCDMVAVVGA